MNTNQKSQVDDNSDAFVIFGRVINRTSLGGIPGLRIEAWDKEGNYDGPVGVGITGLEGDFRISLLKSQLAELFPKQLPDLYFKIYYDDEQVVTTLGEIIWNADIADKEVMIQADWQQEDQYQVSGCIRTEGGVPIPGAVVQAFDKKAGAKPTLLGQQTTDDSGFYRINYTGRVTEEIKTVGADLFVQVNRVGWPGPRQSHRMVNAPADAKINLIVPSDLYRGLSEYERLKDAIIAFVGKDKLLNLDADDSEYIADKLKLAPEKVKHFLHAWQLEVDATKYETQHGIPQAGFYAAMGDGALPDLAGLVSQTRVGLQEALQRAVETNIIPPIEPDEIAGFVETLKKIAVAIAEKAPEDQYSIKNLIGTLNQLPPPLKSRFVQTYIQHEEGLDTFLENLTTDPEFEEHIGSIRELFTLSTLVRQNLSLIQPLVQDIQDENVKDIRSLRDLVRKDAGDWEEYLEKRKVNLPKRETDGKQYSLKEYAQELARTFKKTFPMVDFVQTLSAVKLLPQDKTLQETFVRFFDDNPEFSLGTVSVDHYFHKQLNTIPDAEKRKEASAQQEPLKAELRRWQRIYNLLPDDEQRHERATALAVIEMDEQHTPANTTKIAPRATAPARRIDSALKIASMNRGDFIARWEEVRRAKSGRAPDEIRSEALEIHSRARSISFMVMATALNHAAPLNKVRSRSVTPTYDKSLLRDDADRAFIEYTMATLTTLFGGQDYCECEHCQSVLSPAAYLADLYNNTLHTAFGKNNAWREQLTGRRPDLQRLQFNCKNTETALPYIDLVNELLERSVVSVPSASDDWDLQTTHLAEELALRPEHEYEGAYRQLASALYPFSLPWDKWFEEARIYLDYMGVPLYQLIEAFIPASASNQRLDFQRRRQMQLQEPRIVRALMGLTEASYKLITGVPSPRLKDIFGLKPKDLDKAKQLSLFMRHLGLWKGNEAGDMGAEDFILMRQILETRYIQDSRTEGSRLINLNFQGKPCDFSDVLLNNITEDTVVRIVRFEHLRRALGWTPHELHFAIMTFGKIQRNFASPVPRGRLDKRLLQQISHVVRLKNSKPSISIVELLSWWGPIETGAGLTKLSPLYEWESEQTTELSLYEELFLDKSLYGEQADSQTADLPMQYFTPNEDRTRLVAPEKTLLTTHRAIVCAALGLSEKDFLRLLDFAKAQKYVTDDKLTLENLSGLHRVVSLARFLNISITEFISARELIGIDPFEGVHSPDVKVDIRTESTLLFIEAVDRIQHSPFSIRDLAYLWHHKIESSRELDYVNARIEEQCKQLKSAFGKALNQASVMAPQVEVDLGDDPIEGKKKLEEAKGELGKALAQLSLDQAEFQDLEQIMSATRGDKIRTSEIIKRTLRFLTTQQQRDLLKLLSATEKELLPPLKRCRQFLHYLTPLLQALSVLYQELADFLNVPRDAVKILLERILLGSIPNKVLLHDFMSWAKTSTTRSDQTIHNHLLKLEKIAWIIREWHLTTEEIEYFRTHGEDIYNFDWNRIPTDDKPQPKPPTFRQWAALTHYVEVRDQISLKKGDIVELFKTASDSSKVADVIKMLSGLLNISEQDVNRAIYELGYGVESTTQPTPPEAPPAALRGVAFRNGESIKPVIELARLIKQTGRPCAVIRGWMGRGGRTLDSAFAPGVANLLRYKRETVDEIRNAVKALCQDDQWQTVAREFQDRMRILQRDRLLDFLTRPQLDPQSKAYLYPNEKDIYDYLLIDPLTNPCMNTTRLKQAISSVQLFIHRLLLGLEKKVGATDTDLDILAASWKWKKNYRVWEAYLKVFLYPENWIEPELRDNKSPFFEEFEGELAQSEIDESTIEKAFKNYLRKVDDVGNLEIAAFAEETKEKDRHYFRVFHVVGRSREKPRTHYYRKQNEEGIWLPWQRVDLDIESDALILVIYKGSPYLFWPSTKERIQKLGQDNDNDKNNDKNNYLPVLEIRFNWSRYEDGRWQPKNKTDEHIELMYHWNYRQLTERPEDLIQYRIENGTNGLSIDLYFPGELKTLTKWTWNEQELGKIYADAEKLAAEIQWEHIHGANFKSTANDMVMMIRSLITPNRILTTAYLYGGRPDAAIETLSQIGRPAGILQTFLVTTWDQGWVHNYYYSNGGVNRPPIGIKVEDKQKVFDFWKPYKPYSLPPIEYRAGKWGPIDFDKFTLEIRYGWDHPKFSDHIKQLINLQSTDYWLISLKYTENGNNPVLSTHINDTTLVARMEFSGYRLRAKPSSRTGIVGGPGFDGSLGGSSNVVPEWKLPNHPIQSVSLKNSILSFDGVPLSLDYHEGWSSWMGHPYPKYHQIDYIDPKEPYSLLLMDIADFTIFSFMGTFYTYFIGTKLDDRRMKLMSHFHPLIGTFNEAVNDDRILPREQFDALLKLENQKLSEDYSGAIINSINPISPLVDKPVIDADFTHESPYGLYNWEIFFHIPFTIAVRLSQNRQFAEAQKWFHYIFNPLASLLPNGGHASSKYWNVRPLHELGEPWSIVTAWRIYSFYDIYIEGSPFETALKDQMADLALDPFQPHRVARHRLVAYQMAVVMKYLDNLIAWGDYLFEQDTIESINEATQLYILAAEILGPRPKVVPRKKRIASTGAAPSGSAPTLLNITRYSAQMELVESQMIVPNDLNSLNSASYIQQQTSPFWQWYPTPPASDATGGATETSLAKQPVFCVPHNDKLLTYWDTVAERLFKIRNCQNIEGLVRELPIFEPPIDPGLLVRGRALNIDISELLSDLYAPLPPYRFRVMLQKAYEFCGDVRSLGASLLSALEKQDAEELSLLRAGHEKQMLQLTRAIKKQQIEELRENLKSVQVSLDMAEARFDYYSSRQFANPNEKAQVSNLEAALGFQIASQAVSVGASIAFMFPQIHWGVGPPETEQGGLNWGQAFQATSQLLSLIASIYSHEANMHGIQAGWERRMDDWKFQASQARKEMQQLEKQLLAAEIRLAIAEKELENHEKQQEQAEEVETFMQSKFTNKELYHWMVSQTSSLYFQTYRMAVELAKMAQKCYQYETGNETATFINAAYWDNLKKGLLAGEKLQFDLRRMEDAYLRGNDRELELTKHISLRALDPVELDMLRYTGSCKFKIPELLFDLDYPGHYYRRIKSVSISIPSVVGPYTGVNCVLTLDQSSMRVKPKLEEANVLSDYRKAQIALSSGQNDSGLFELNHNDERYLPFESRGVVSTWRLEFPSDYASFDHSTIPDVIIHMRYSARVAEDVSFKDDIKAGITKTYNAFKIKDSDATVIGQRFDIRREFPDLWHRFTSGSGIKLEINKEYFPYLLRPLTLKITHLSLLCELNEALALGETISFEVDKAPTSDNKVNLPTMGVDGKHLFKALTDVEDFVVPDSLTIKAGSNTTPIEKLKELIVILHFEISKKGTQSH